jgi:hypothetical protein
MLKHAAGIPHLQRRLGRPVNVAVGIGELDPSGSKNWPVPARQLRCRGVQENLRVDNSHEGTAVKIKQTQISDQKQGNLGLNKEK